MGVTARPAAGAAALAAAGLSALAGLAGAAATADPAHLLPRWQPTFDLASSTIVQPCNDSGLMEPSFLAKWGVHAAATSLAGRRSTDALAGLLALACVSDRSQV